MAILTEPIEPRGPIVRISIGLDDEAAAKRRAARLPNLRPHTCEALVDTGAGRCLISPQVVADLGLESTGLAALGTASTAGSRQLSPMFSVVVTLTVRGRSMAAEIDAIESDLSDLNVGALFGRDFLAKCLLVYNGPSGAFTLSF